MKFSSNALFLIGSVSAFWRKDMNPGMMLRIDEYSVEAMKSVISRHIPKNESYFDNVPMIKDFTYKYNSRLPGCDWSVDWTDIKYSDLDLEMDDVTFELTRMDGTFGEVLMDFPALHFWTISAT
jgi:hypothetical protein